MAFIVTARIRHGSERIMSKRFRKRSTAQAFADLTNRDRPGSNARVREVR